ncbi:MAG: phosphoribosylanthranilate isomerase [Lachnospiraceae bacterium]|nr:phosphoribosylanthranilate isomerase [Lachnospiraceae bacterium]
MTGIKICGLQRPEDIEAVNAAGPDYIGFVFAEGKRKVTKEQAHRLKERLSASILAVGVFVNEDPDTVADTVRAVPLDLVQLHGDEDEAYIRRLRSLLGEGIPLIRAVRVKSREQIQRAEQLPCEYLLLDTYVKGQYGGSGKSFDRKLIPPLSKPFFLAGGLTGENLKEALEGGESRPFCVDISSGAETDGKKDAEKIQKLVRIVRNAG